MARTVSYLLMVATVFLILSIGLWTAAHRRAHPPLDYATNSSSGGILQPLTIGPAQTTAGSTPSVAIADSFAGTGVMTSTGAMASPFKFDDVTLIYQGTASINEKDGRLVYRIDNHRVSRAVFNRWLIAYFQRQKQGLR